jgi:hypothetical protein
VHWVNQTYRRNRGVEVEIDSKTLVSTGLYEGETAIYYSIASKDLETAKWLLEKDVE